MKPSSSPDRTSPFSRTELLTICLCLASVAVAADEASIGRYVRQLGAASFVAREDAAVQLLTIGAAAVPALRDAAGASDREVRVRAKRVLELIHRNRRNEDLAAFKSHGTLPEDAPYAELPGWAAFSTRYGRDSAARATFALMFEAEWNLLMEFFATESPDDHRTLTSRRYETLTHARPGTQHFSVGTMLAFLFLAAEQPEEFKLHREIYSFVQHRELRRLLVPDQRGSSDERQLARKIVGDWLVSASRAQLSEVVSLQAARYFRMHDVGSKIAKRVLTDGDSLPLSKSSAMQAIVLRGDKTQIPLIEAFLTDTTRLSTVGQRVCELRDVALASLMQLNGHDVRKIGVTPTPHNALAAFSYNTLGFISEEDRQAAFKTYEDLQAAKQSKAQP